MIIWLCGLSGAGKTTIGTQVSARLKKTFSNLVILDGDDLRAAIGGGVGYDQEARDRNSVHIAGICRVLDKQGIHVIVCAVTLAEEAQRLNREHLSDYLEVYLSVDRECVERRDPKGLYAKASEGTVKNLAGIDIPYHPPEAPHLTINNKHDLDNVTPIVDEIIEASGLLKTSNVLSN